ncbi:alpha/beta hydrolase [Hydrogenophaga sp.]|uniref:alpha/beta hydrolase n=1 Tax=Hydrogenophaga sp. TaxID=1904254 RepID=UPI002AB9A687|nr:alpha/beta hydrolase [Hydrogenophaga sp.]MDZ4144115.1 alpha/beta hydrolase [Burkholderiales bacterium]MDZ4396284.1 alpha/beta hydrolase [Hydrogenophaga sp.]
MSLIVFSHANSFPAGTYNVLFKSLRARGFTVRAVDKFGHDPDYPVTNNWPHLVRQLADFTEAEVQKAGKPAFLVGHSLGGFLSLMCAARHPHLARGVLLVDSPILGGWRATTLGVIKRTQLVGAVSPGAVSRQRRDRWPDADAAREHFRHKKAFARWEPQVLDDYIRHGTRTHAGECVLAFDRAIETAIYNTLPDNLDRLIRRHPLKCPVAFVGGRQSAEMKQVGMTMTQRVIGAGSGKEVLGRIMMLDGSHLFPMEKPLATAAAIEASLRNLGA